ncbi:Glucans biosynthesis protein G precursor [Roseovarius albus]|uniref:Glucans biosynthesis protein G n=1 Tax=Roseovarius albus TaxID=1247867 RepID=A0A1X6YLH8_9RHOB|nr:glucan biosynthesis protein G [Roseovarius albus]SLN24997.1 Glucans biosynthesis protein G precursor [Roseovarius albus]
MDRRDFLGFVSAFAGMATLPAHAADGTVRPHFMDSTPFDLAGLIARAKQMAEAPYEPRAEVPQAWKDLSYDEYRAIRYRSGSALWRDTQTPFQVDFFAPGLYFHRTVQINVVEDAQSHRVAFDFELFDKSNPAPDLPIAEDLGFSGFRLRTEIKKPGRYDEFFVMQGASYFRAVGRDNAYGLSARGLAIDTGEASGEEFPDFTEFWIERPEPGQDHVLIHAFMDSPSVTGVYSFTVMPGDATKVDVTARLFPRDDISHAGIAPLTSMFLFDETNRNRFDDFRPAVHDNDGLMIQNGAGETLWRPLANPIELQVSSFVDTAPKGFGLMQRANQFSDFADLEAHYHKRPSLWIEPAEDWGKGAVTLVEIPADREIYDNIVAYWRPADGLPKGQETTLNYRMYWGNGAPSTAPVAKVLNTRLGKRFEGGYIVTIDFESIPVLLKDLEELTLFIGSNTGTHSEGIVQRNPETGGLRLAFTFDPEGAQAVELRAQLRHNKANVSEVWLYRWTAS